MNPQTQQKGDKMDELERSEVIPYYTHLDYHGIISRIEKLPKDIFSEWLEGYTKKSSETRRNFEDTLAGTFKKLTRIPVDAKRQAEHAARMNIKPFAYEDEDTEEFRLQIMLFSQDINQEGTPYMEDLAKDRRKPLERIKGLLAEERELYLKSTSTRTKAFKEELYRIHNEKRKAEEQIDWILRGSLTQRIQVGIKVEDDGRAAFTLDLPGLEEKEETAKAQTLLGRFRRETEDMFDMFMDREETVREIFKMKESVNSAALLELDRIIDRENENRPGGTSPIPKTTRNEEPRTIHLKSLDTKFAREITHKTLWEPTKSQIEDTKKRMKIKVSIDSTYQVSVKLSPKFVKKSKDMGKFEDICSKINLEIEKYGFKGVKQENLLGPKRKRSASPQKNKQGKRL